MKTINKLSKLFSLTTTCLLILGLVACTNLFGTKIEKAYIKISATTPNMRTVLPTKFDENSTGLTWTLSGTKDNTTVTFENTWSDTNDKTAYQNMTSDTFLIPETESWTFTLIAQIDGKDVLLGKLTNYHIAAGPNTLNFTMTEATGNNLANGEIKFTLNFSENIVSKVEASLYKYDGNDFSSSTTHSETFTDVIDSITYTNTVEAGYYRLRLELYQNVNNSNEKINTYSSLVRVAPGLCSSGSYTIEKLAQLFTVTYNPNGGTMPSNFTSETHNGYTSFELPTPTKEGYEFAGWYTPRNEQVGENGIYTLTSDIALTAGWEAVKYSITYNLNEGTNSTSNPSTYTVETPTITFEAPTRDGYNFVGWFTDANFGTPITTIPNGSTGNKTLYAKWEEKVTTYTINFDANRGTLTGETTRQLTPNDTLPTPTKEGYTFAGWYEVNNNVVADTKFDITSLNQDVSLFARYYIPIDMVNVIPKSSSGTFTSITSSYFDNYSIVGGKQPPNNYTIGKFEVTQEQYEAVMEYRYYNGTEISSNPSVCTENSSEFALPSSIYGTQSKRPVDSLTWYEAVYFCDKLSEMMGLEPVYEAQITSISRDRITNLNYDTDSEKNGFRLPTELEWEIAARGGDETKTDWDYEISGSASSTVVGSATYTTYIDTYGWYAYNNKSGTTGNNDVTLNEDGMGSHQVGQLTANSLNLYDMSGNVWEWCEDSINQETDFSEPDTSLDVKALRSGSWCSYYYWCQVGYRYGFDPSETANYNYDIGFRLVRSGNYDEYETPQN